MMTSDHLPDPKLLRLFDVLYEVRSVTRTAEQLGQSQPTVSIWLQRLRAYLRDPLFTRTPEGMMPTPQADALIGPCREILQMMGRLSAWDMAFDPPASQRRFRICMTDASHITLLPRLLSHVRSVAPGIRLEALQMNEHTERALGSGEADLAIGYVPWLSGGIYQHHLYGQDWVCLANKNHPRLHGAISARQFRVEGHIGIAAGTGAKLLEHALARARLSRNVVLELPGFLGLGAILQTTDLIATLPRHIGETLATANGIACLPCPIPIDSFAVRQYWHARYHNESGNRWLRGIVTQLFSAPR